MDTHFVVVPGLRTLTARRLTGGVRQNLSGETNRALDVELLVLGAVHEVIAHLFETLHIARRESDTDLVQLHGSDRGIDILVLGDVAHLDNDLGTSGDQVKEKKRAAREFRLIKTITWKYMSRGNERECATKCTPS